MNFVNSFKHSDFPDRSTTRHIILNYRKTKKKDNFERSQNKQLLTQRETKNNYINLLFRNHANRKRLEEKFKILQGKRTNTEFYIYKNCPLKVKEI